MDTITIPTVEYEALLARLEDAEDALAIRQFDAAVAANGFAATTRNHLPMELAERILDGEHPVRIRREHRKLSGARLAELSGVPQSYISDIEARKKPGSVAALGKLAKALDVQIDDLV
jgi:hypothetical protein